MLAASVVALRKQPIKVPNFKLLSPPLPPGPPAPHLSNEHMKGVVANCTVQKKADLLSVGPSSAYCFAGVCTWALFSPEMFTGWRSDGVKEWAATRLLCLSTVN